MQSWASLRGLHWQGRDGRHFELRARREPPVLGEPRPGPFSAARARRWLDTLEQPATGFALLRIYLGVGLIVRGALFVANPAVIQRVLNDPNGWALPYLGDHLIAGVHMVGGALLAFGFLTRFAALVQIPVLVGAVFLVHFREGLFSTSQSLEFSLLVLVMLVLYALFGAGPLSIDYLLRHRELMQSMTDAKLAARASPREADEIAAWDVVDEAGWESFPASDPPATVIDEPRLPEASIYPAPAEDPARQPYKDARVELLCVVGCVIAVTLLLVFGHFAIAALGLTAATIMFGVWRVGRANFV
jgi:putative oxidoreductase